MNTDQLKDKWIQFKDELKLQWASVRTMTCSRLDGSTTDLSAKSKNGMAIKRES